MPTSSEESETPPQPSVQVASAKDDELVAIFVGKNYAYFKRKWETAEKKKSNTSWNWAAFLWPPIWIAYRKMYLFCGIYIGAAIVLTVCEILLELPTNLSYIISGGIGCVVGWQGNYWYKLHVEQRIKEITTLSTSEQVKTEVARRGGTSVGAAIGFLALFIVLGMLAVAVAV